MKLLRVGPKGKEVPAILDKNNIIRDLSSYISDFNPDNLNYEEIKRWVLELLRVPSGLEMT